MSDEVVTLQALFAAALEVGNEAEAKDPWLSFLARLAEATEAESALLRVFWHGSPSRRWLVGADWAGPGLETVERMRSGRIYSEVDLPGLDPGENAFRKPLRALRVTLRQEGLGLLALQRSGEEFRARAGLQLSHLSPYLATGLIGWRDLSRERTHASVDRRLSGSLGSGWIVFTSAGQVSAMAEGLPERLSSLAGITLRADKRLSFPDPQASAALRPALATLEPGEVLFLEFSRRPLVQMALSHEVLDGEPAFLGRLRHGLSARSLPIERVQDLFGLNRSEARLAVRLCDGLSLQEAAQDLGWTQETTRSCSKRLFARMGVTGQPGVVRRMMESAVWHG